MQTPRRVPPADATLGFDRTVPCALAHRRAVHEVFVTDSAHLAADEFLVAVQLPRAHSLWSDRPRGYYDPLMSVEAARQATFVAMHNHLNVPLGLPGSLQRIDFQVEDIEAYKDNADRPLQGLLRGQLVNEHRHNGLIAMTVEAELWIGESPAMALNGDIVVFPTRDYEVLRAHVRARKPLASASESQPPALAPAAVGRSSPANVVVGGESREPTGGWRYTLIVDESHPTFFDHAQDHVPGPLILEAYRQAALATSAHECGASPLSLVLTACRAQFVDYGEPEVPVQCTAQLDSDCGRELTLTVGLHQFGAQIAEGEVRLRMTA